MNESELGARLNAAALAPTRQVDPSDLRRRARQRRRSRRVLQSGLAAVLVVGAVGAVVAFVETEPSQQLDSVDIPDAPAPRPGPPDPLVPTPSPLDPTTPTTMPVAPAASSTTPPGAGSGEPSSGGRTTPVEPVTYSDPVGDFEISSFNVFGSDERPRSDEPNVDIVGGSISVLDAETVRFVVQVADLEPGDPPGSDGISIQISFTHHDPDQPDGDRFQGLLIQRHGDFELLRVYEGCAGCTLRFDHDQDQVIADVPIAVFRAELASGRYYLADVPPVQITPTSLFWYFEVRTALIHSDAEEERCEDRDRGIGCSTYYSESKADHVAFKGPYAIGQHLHANDN